MPPEPVRLLVSAAEASGDLLAADLLRELREIVPFTARGVAGPALRGVGVEPLAAMEDLAAAGLWEVAERLPALRAARRALEADLGAADLLLVTDAPDFHLPLARVARRRGLPVVGYVSPQVWAWRPGRVRTLARSLDRLLCLFPFEPALYAPHGLDARYVGHPVVDRLAAVRVVPEPGVYALLPGSRRHEVERLLPAFRETARRIRGRDPAARFLLGWSPSLPRPQDLGGLEGITVVEGLVEAARRCSAALVASGTATLELAVLGVPMVICYQVHPVTWSVGRLLVHGVRHLGLPNILAGRPIVPEHLQRLDPDRMAADLLAAAGGSQRDDLERVRVLLGPGGCSRRAAEAVAEGFVRPSQGVSCYSRSPWMDVS